MRTHGVVDLLSLQFARARGHDEQMQAALLAGLLKLGGELASAIDLQRANGKRHADLQGIEEFGRGRGGGVFL